VNILLVTLFFPPDRTAGTENYTLAVARGLARRGHQVRVVCAGEWGSGSHYWNGISESEVDGLTVTRLNLNWLRASNPNRVLYDSPIVEQWFERYLAAARPDLVHVTSTVTLGVGVLRAVHRLRIRLVLTLMDFWFLCPRTTLQRADGRLCSGHATVRECERCQMQASRLFRRLGGWMPGRATAALWSGTSRVPALARLRGARGLALNINDRRALLGEALRLPDLVIAHSRFVKDTFEDAGLVGNVRYLPNGHEFTGPGAHVARSPGDVLRVGFMGQIAELKGLHTLVEGFLLADMDGRARLDIWGDPRRDPDYAAPLRAMTEGHPSITWRGAFRHDDVGEVLRQIDVLVVPSNWYENAPLVIQEAFAAGTPVVATGIGGMAEAVSNEVNGLHFARNDAADLSRQLRRLVEEPGLLRRLAAAVPAVKAIDAEVAELETAYSMVLSSAAGRAERSAAVPEGEA
jgi:glycosyltransferase involved in cell wall biosynthesis